MPLAPVKQEAEPPVAFPRLIMFYGDLLPEPLFADTFEDIGRILISGGAVYGAPLEDRPYIELKLFWHNPTWEPYAQDPDKRKTLRPEDADRTCVLFDCNGRYYPAFGGEPGVMFAEVYGENGRRLANIVLDTEALRVLERIGLPMSLKSN